MTTFYKDLRTEIQRSDIYLRVLVEVRQRKRLLMDASPPPSFRFSMLTRAVGSNV